MTRAEPVSLSGSPLGPGRDVDPRVVWLHGEHDIATVDSVSKALARAVALDGADLVVDLSGVRFMGAETIGVIVGARNALHLQSRSLLLRSPSAFARRVIELCGLGDLIDPPTAAPVERAAPGALDSWVEVPTTGRVDPAVASPPEHADTDDRDSEVVPIEAIGLVGASRVQVDDLATTRLAGRGGP